MRPIVDSLFRFSPADFPSVNIDTLRKELTFRSLSGEKYGFGESQTVEMLIEKEGIVAVPRRYAYERFPENMLRLADDQISLGSKVEIGFREDKQSKRPELKIRQDALIRQFLAGMEFGSTPMRGGILCAACGTGKTVMATKLMSILGVTALVVVHKEFLAEQWKEKLLEFTDLKEEDIGIVQQTKCKFEGKKVVLAMVQSIMDPSKYPEEFLSWPGVCIYDETHRMSAPLFQSAIPWFPAKYRIGVTATPRRSDGLQPVFEWHIGKILATMPGGNEVLPKIYQVKFETYVPESFYIWRGKDNEIIKTFLGKLVTILAEMEKRNLWLSKEIAKAATSGRKIMVLSDRREHLDILHKMLESMKQDFSIGYYIGGMKKSEREESAQADIILATYAMAKEGLDIPEIDTLFLATPKTDVEQSVGRILRYHEDKKEPLVVDIVDSLPFCEDFAGKRRRQYKKLGWSFLEK